MNVSMTIVLQGPASARSTTIINTGTFSGDSEPFFCGLRICASYLDPHGCHFVDEVEIDMRLSAVSMIGNSYVNAWPACQSLVIYTFFTD